jgi:PhnB protein
MIQEYAMATTPSSAQPLPAGYPRVSPYLCVEGAAAAIAFYAAVFGAETRMRLDAPDGTVAHAEMAIGSSVVMLGDPFPGMGFQPPGVFGGTPVTLHLYVPDVDATVATALEAGAKLVRPAADQFYGDRTATVQDPFGHVWSLATHVEDVAPQEIQRRFAAMFANAG